MLMVIGSCTHQPQKGEEQVKDDLNQQQALKTGLKIEYGPNLGMIDEFTAGNYIHITATITNDTTIPIIFQADLSEEYEFPDTCRDSKFKAFLLPKVLTPDTATLYNNLANTATEELGSFLDNCLKNPQVLNKTLDPGEYTVITIGTLFSTSTKCAALPRAIFSPNDTSDFQYCDNRLSQGKSSSPPIELGVKIDFYSGKGSTRETCVVIPCGQISYPKQ